MARGGYEGRLVDIKGALQELVAELKSAAEEEGHTEIQGQLEGEANDLLERGSWDTLQDFAAQLDEGPGGGDDGGSDEEE